MTLAGRTYNSVMDKHKLPHGGQDCSDKDYMRGIFKKLFDVFEWQQAAFRGLLDFLSEWRAEQKENTCSDGQDRDLNVVCTAVEGRRSFEVVNKFVIPKLLDVNSVVLSAFPRKNGEIDTSAVVDWASSDPSSAGLEAMPEFDYDDSDAKDGSKMVHIPASFRIRVTTPLDSASGLVITATAAGYDKSQSDPFEYAPGADRNLNVSVGDPELDS